jgi:hypothetical protein
LQSGLFCVILGLSQNSTHMSGKRVLRSKVLNEASRLIEQYEKQKGSKELNPLLESLRDFKKGLLKEKGTFISPKIEKEIIKLRGQLKELTDD